LSSITCCQWIIGWQNVENRFSQETLTNTFCLYCLIGQETFTKTLLSIFFTQ
jgi:hypothetical protein